MQHIDEHTLELYALNSASIADRRVAIEEHLAECAGCRDLVARMTDAYGRADELVRELETEGTGTADQLPVLTPRGVVPGAQRRVATAPLRPPTRMERTRYFMQRHPVFTGAGSFMALAGLLLAANFIFRPPAPPMNPVFVRYNENTNAAEILDSNYKFLWQIPTRFVADFQRFSHSQGEQMTVVRDIDGDGWNEVVTTLWHPGTTPRGDSQSLRIYEHDGDLRIRKSFAAHVNYLQRRYEENWTATFCVVPDDTARAKNLYVVWNSGRSPEVLTRLGADGSELGQYWHFGNISVVFSLESRVPLEGRILVAGIDDAEDSATVSVPFAAVLDPARLTGVGKSVASQGFNMAEAQTEEFYIRFAPSPLSRALSQNSYVHRACVNGNGTISLWVMNGSYEITDETDLYEYVFATDMQLLQVKSTSMTELFYMRKVREGVVSGSIDAAYLAKLKDGVRYWDGEKWVKEAVKIRQNIKVSQAKQ
jgi:hypothetical protein